MPLPYVPRAINIPRLHSRGLFGSKLPPCILNGSSNVHLAALFGRFHYHHAQVVHIAPSDGRILTISASGYYITSVAKKTACIYQFFPL